MGDAARSHERWRRRPCGRPLWTTGATQGLGVGGTGQRRLLGRLLTGSFQQIKTAKLTLGGSSSVGS